MVIKNQSKLGIVYFFGLTVWRLLINRSSYCSFLKSLYLLNTLLYRTIGTFISDIDSSFSAVNTFALNSGYAGIFFMLCTIVCASGFSFGLI